MTGEQLSFPDAPLSGPLAGDQTPMGALTARRPGWTLLAPSDTPQPQWHLIERRDPDGVLTARCGAVGRYVADTEREIIRCSLCEAADPSV